MLVNSMRRETP